MILALIMIVYLSTVAAQGGQYYSPSKPYYAKLRKITNLHFFFHENFAGTNPTVALVAQANNKSNDNKSSASPFKFGNVYVANDPLKMGPEDNSEVIGNAQGLAVITEKDASTAVGYMDFGFTSGPFNGSSINIYSRIVIKEMDREVAVVGGKGKFRLAQGFALLKVHSMNASTVIVEYNVTVIHDDGEYESVFNAAAAGA